MTNHPLLAALRFYGETPIPGPGNNPTIVNFLKATSYPGPFVDEVAWCSAFLVWIFRECKIATPANAAARSWLNYSVDTDQPALGDVVVLAWPKEAPTHAHVGLFIRETADLVFILAGNQNNEVDITPWRKRSVLSYRKLTGE